MSSHEEEIENTTVSEEQPSDQAGQDAIEVPADDVESSELVRLQADIEKFRDLALRSQADLDNYRKRATREREEAIRYANAALLTDLIPILDNFELGLAAAKNDPGAQSIHAGMSMVLKQIQDFLGNHGVTLIEAEGAEFDPNLHDAIAQEASDTVPEGHVVRQLRKGYRLKDRLLRPSHVIVSKGPETAPAN
jgi:molecular chaperone GrpE